MASDKVCPFLGKGCIETACKLWTLHSIRKAEGGANVTVGECALKWIAATGFMRLEASVHPNDERYDKFCAFLNQSELECLDVEK